MKLKRSIAIMISVVLIFASLTSLVTAATTPTDIAGHWGEKYIQRLVDEDIIHGYDDGTFRPDNSITRAEFCTIISNALVKGGYIEGLATPTGIFSDVPADYWGAKYIETAYNNGYVNGKDDNKFDPEANITRQEMAKIISLVYCDINTEKTFDQLDAEFNADDYGLVDLDAADSWALPFIHVCLVTGLMKGDGANFNPQGQVTRAETATVTYRILGYDNPVVTETPTQTPTQTPVPTPGPIREHGQLLTIQSAALTNYPDYVQPNANCPITILWDGLSNDHNVCFTCDQNEPEYLFDLGSVQDIESFGIKGYSTGYQNVYFRLLISSDQESWEELGAEVPCRIGQPIIADPTQFVVDNFDGTTGAPGANVTMPTKFDVTTEDSYFSVGNFQIRTLLTPGSGDERDVECFASPMFDHTLTGVDWSQYGFVNSNCDYMFNYFMDEVHQARYIKIIGYGNSMTQYYMFSSLQEVQVFGPGNSYDKPAE